MLTEAILSVGTGCASFRTCSFCSLGKPIWSKWQLSSWRLARSPCSTTLWIWLKDRLSPLMSRCSSVLEFIIITHRASSKSKLSNVSSSSSSSSSLHSFSLPFGNYEQALNARFSYFRWFPLSISLKNLVISSLLSKLRLISRFDRLESSWTRCTRLLVHCLSRPMFERVSFLSLKRAEALSSRALTTKWT